MGWILPCRKAASPFDLPYLRNRDGPFVAEEGIHGPSEVSLANRETPVPPLKMLSTSEDSRDSYPGHGDGYTSISVEAGFVVVPASGISRRRRATIKTTETTTTKRAATGMPTHNPRRAPSPVSEPLDLSGSGFPVTELLVAVGAEFVGGSSIELSTGLPVGLTMGTTVGLVIGLAVTAIWLLDGMAEGVTDGLPVGFTVGLPVVGLLPDGVPLG